MTLIIDETPVRFTLENEKTVEDLVRAVNDHVKEYYSYVKSVVVDGEQYETDPQKSVQLEGLSAVQVHTAHIHELYLAKLEFLHEVLQERIQNPDNNLLERIQVDTNELQSIAGSVLSEDDSNALIGELTENNNAGLQDALLKKIQYRVQCLHDPLQSCNKAMKALEAMLEQMKENPVQLQGGDIQAVVAHLITFSELLQDIIRSYLLCTHRYPSLPAIDFSDLQNHLQELKLTLSEEALDTVMLADLIEYEIIPTGKEWIEKTVKSLDAVNVSS